MPDIDIQRFRGGLAAVWYEDGKRRRFGLAARTRAQAEAEALAVYRRETLSPARGTTVADLWEAYRTEKQGRRVAEAMRHETAAVMGHFGTLQPAEVSTEIVRAYTDTRRAAGKHDGTIWTELGHLRTVFRWAAYTARLIDHAPAVERPPKPAPKDRWLTEAEIGRLMGAPAAFHIDLAVILMLATAGRVTAVLELTWDRVDFEAGTIDLRVGDGPRKGRAIVPMNAMARAALITAREAALTDNVVEWGGKPVRSIKTGFNAKVAAAGLEGVTPHVLRHTAAVHMAKSGRPMSRISQYLGHTSTSVTERVYARFAPEHLRDEAEVLNFARLTKRTG